MRPRRSRASRRACPSSSSATGVGVAAGAQQRVARAPARRTASPAGSAGRDVVEPGAGEDPADAVEVERLAGVRGRGQREQLAAPGRARARPCRRPACGLLDERGKTGEVTSPRASSDGAVGGEHRRASRGGRPRRTRSGRPRRGRPGARRASRRRQGQCRASRQLVDRRRAVAVARGRSRRSARPSTCCTRGAGRRPRARAGAAARGPRASSSSLRAATSDRCGVGDDLLDLAAVLVDAGRLDA